MNDNTTVFVREDFVLFDSLCNLNGVGLFYCLVLKFGFTQINTVEQI